MAMTTFGAAPARRATLGSLTTAVTVASSTTATTFGDVTINKDGVSVGDVFVLTARGVLSTTGTPTLNVGVYVGGVATSGVTGTMTQGSGVTNEPFEVRAVGTVRATGSSGSIIWAITFQLDGGTDILKMVNATSADTVDTTAAFALALYGTWGTNSSSNTFTITEYTVERL